MVGTFDRYLEVMTALGFTMTAPASWFGADLLGPRRCTLSGLSVLLGAASLQPKLLASKAQDNDPCGVECRNQHQSVPTSSDVPAFPRFDGLAEGWQRFSGSHYVCLFSFGVILYPRPLDKYFAVRIRVGPAFKKNARSAYMWSGMLV